MIDDFFTDRPVVSVEATHALRVLTGCQAGVIFRLAYQRVRVGRPYQYRPDEFFLIEAAPILGRSTYLVQVEPGMHRLESSMGGGIVVDGEPIGREGRVLHDGQTIWFPYVQVIYELLSSR